MIGFILEKVAEVVAGSPDSKRWAYLSGLFCWIANLGIVTWMLTRFIGYPEFGACAFRVFEFFIVITLSMNWTRIRHTAQIRHSSGTHAAQ